MYSVFTAFKAIDKVTPTVNKIISSTNRMQNRVSSGVSMMGNSYKKLQTDIFSARNAFRLFFLTMGTKRIIDTINSIAESGDRLAKTAITIDMTAQSLRELIFVGERLGISEDVVTRGIEKMNRNIGELQKGTGTLYRSLSLFSPSTITDLMKVEGDPMAQFKLLVKTIETLPNTFQKTALSVGAFGRTGVPLLKMVKAGTIEVDNLIDRFKFYAGTKAIGGASKSTQDYMDKVANFKASMFGLRMAIGEKVLPVFAKLIERTALLIRNNREMLSQRISDMFLKVGKALTFIVNNFEKIWNTLKLIGKAFISFKIASFAIKGMLFFSSQLIGQFLYLFTVITSMNLGLSNAQVAMASFNAITMANPILLIPTAITAIVAGLTLAYMWSERFRNVVNGIGVMFNTYVLPVFQKMFDISSKIVSKFMELNYVLRPLIYVANKLESIGKNSKNITNATNSNIGQMSNQLKQLNETLNEDLSRKQFNETAERAGTRSGLSYDLMDLQTRQMVNKKDNEQKVAVEIIANDMLTDMFSFKAKHQGLDINKSLGLKVLEVAQ